MKTAMQELIESFNLNKDLDPFVLSMVLRGKMQELLEKERQQIIDAYCANMGQVTQAIKDDAEQHYNETYNETNNSKA